MASKKAALAVNNDSARLLPVFRMGLMRIGGKNSDPR